MPQVNLNAHVQLYLHRTKGNGLRMRHNRLSGAWLFRDQAPLILINKKIDWDLWCDYNANMQTI